MSDSLSVCVVVCVMLCAIVRGFVCGLRVVLSVQVWAAVCGCVWFSLSVCDCVVVCDWM